MCILNSLIMKRNIFSRKLPLALFRRLHLHVYLQWCFYSNFCFVIAPEKQHKMKTFSNFSLSFSTFVATYFQINHERNINSAAFNIRIFLNHFAFAISSHMHKSGRDMHAQIVCGKEVFIDFINLSAKSSVLNYLWKHIFRLSVENFVCMWTHASSLSWFHPIYWILFQRFSRRFYDLQSLALIKY